MNAPVSPICPSCGSALIRTPGTGLILPLPPSCNTMYATVHGRRVLSASATAYKTQVAWLFNLGGGWRTQSLVAFYVDIYRKRRAGDTDNYLKCLLDSGTGILWNDDSQVVEIHARRFDDPKKPHVEVWIEEVQQVIGQLEGTE